MTQQIINIGSFPDDPAADPLRTAFGKIQNNFTELYTNTLSSNVNQINPIQGLYEIHGRTVGDLTLATVFPNVTIQTGTNVKVGVANTSGSGGVAMGNSTTITRWDTAFYIDLAPNITTANATFTTATTTDITVSGVVASNLIPSANSTFSLGNNTARWKDVYANGNIRLGTVTLTSDANSFLFPNANVTGNIIVSSNVSSNNLSVTANAAIGNISVSGNASVSGEISSGSLSVNSNANVGGNVLVVGNITSTKTLSIGNIAASGNITVNGTAAIAGNLSAGNIFASLGTGTFNKLVVPSVANITTANIMALYAGNVDVTGNVSANYFHGTYYGPGTGLTGIPGANVTGQSPNSLVAGTVYTNAQPNITSVGTLTSLTLSGNISGANHVTASYFAGNGAALTAITGANVTGQSPNSLVSGTVYTNAQPNITSVGLLTSVSVNGNAYVGNVVSATTFTGAGTGLTNIPGANVTGVVPNATVAVYAGTVTTNAQPNITSVGTLSSLTVTGNAEVGNLVQNGYTFMGVDTGIISAGSDYANATQLVKQVNVISASAIGQGVKLPTAAPGLQLTIINTTTNQINLFPGPSAQIDFLTTGTPYILGAKAKLQFVATSSNNWYTLTAVYG